jgi:hypothetical protein
MAHVHPANDMAAADRQASVMALYPYGFLGEPALADLLRDPIAKALMVADHVDRRDLKALLETTRHQISPRCRGPAVP